MVALSTTEPTNLSLNKNTRSTSPYDYYLELKKQSTIGLAARKTLLLKQKNLHILVQHKHGLYPDVTKFT